MDNETQNRSDQPVNYNSTARNVDQKDVSGKPEPVSGTNSDPDDRDEELNPEFDDEQTKRGYTQ